VGIGAAVAINVPILKNEAYIGEQRHGQAGGLVVEALMTDVDGDKKQVFGAEATSGASGKSVGIAGSLAISILDAQSRAAIGSGAQVTLTGGDARLTAENTTVSKAVAEPANAGAVAGSVGVGRFGGAEHRQHANRCGPGRWRCFDGSARDLSLSATSDNSVITTAKAGGAATGGSGVGIGGAVAISVVNNETQAFLGSGVRLET
jgi:hypothetical protein